MKYFVLVYNQKSGELRIEEFPAGAGLDAQERRFELELEYRRDPDLEIVMLGADTIDDLMRTHARYFKSISELAAAS
jgi:hypothetical protein